jgi:hypothetical protein
MAVSIANGFGDRILDLARSRNIGQDDLTSVRRDDSAGPPIDTASIGAISHRPKIHDETKRVAPFP